MLMEPWSGWTSPWREVERLQREMNRLLGAATQGPSLAAARGYPAMNVWTDENGAVVTAELPGINPEEIEIGVQNDTLTLRGTRLVDETPEGVTYHRRERGRGTFARSLQLPFRVEAGKVQAGYTRGILRITLPRAEADRPKKIAIRAG